MKSKNPHNPTQDEELDEPQYDPSFRYSLIVIACIVAVLLTGMIVLELPSSITIFIAYIVTLVLALPITRSYRVIQNCAFDAIRQAQEAIFILIGVGALLGTWMLAGTIPTLVDVGLQLVSPQYFLITALFLCSIVSIATGTAFGAIGTVGLALLVIANGAGIPAAPTAAAIVCGALFGDKLSPLSDTTNLTAAMARVNMITHIKHMLWTTVPAYVITALFFFLLDMRHHAGSVKLDSTAEMLATIEANFNVDLINLVPLIVVIVLLACRIPAFLALIFGALSALPFAIWKQGHSFSDALVAIFDGTQTDTGNDAVDTLLSGGGIAEIVSTVVVLILLAVALGGVLGGTGILRSILKRLKSATKSSRRAILTTLGLTLLGNIITAAQTTAIVATGTLMRPVYKKLKLHPKNLSRALEDSGTMTAFLVPWNTAAIFAVGVLGVGVAEYGPYAVFAYLTPIISAIYALTGFTIAHLNSRSTTDLEPESKNSLT
ncbi:Na+/H+ antiporter NhaC [Brevibacterium zhoupengii]|uniref:Na+/H+ antiporter NhaC n=1 Tax=Brevibacterium zhoupengii TaxID=2898795 RepID=UPI001E39EC23|nr:Na+/H+ antiporter NhaC [Brevibacterium zhoupengii]